jgi:hypothetical protein
MTGVGFSNTKISGNNNNSNNNNNNDNNNNNNIVAIDLENDVKSSKVNGEGVVCGNCTYINPPAYLICDVCNLEVGVKNINKNLTQINIDDSDNINQPPNKNNSYNNCNNNNNNNNDELSPIDKIVQQKIVSNNNKIKDLTDVGEINPNTLAYKINENKIKQTKLISDSASDTNDKMIPDNQYVLTLYLLLF